MSARSNEIAEQILNDAYQRVTRARVGGPGKDAPELTPEQVIWDGWSEENPAPETR